MNNILRLTLATLLVGTFILSLPTASFAQSTKLNNEFFLLEVNLPGWLPMARGSLDERSDYASENSGRTINYVDGLSNTLDVVPHIIFQQLNSDLSTKNIKAHLRDMASSVSRPTHLHEVSSPMPMPKATTEMHFNLYEEYALMKSEVVYENEPCYNFSYLIPHGKGMMYMHSYCHIMDETRFYPEFEQIRKNLKFIFPTSSAQKQSTNNSGGETKNETGQTSSQEGGNFSKYIFMALAVMLLLFILAKASKPK